MFEQIYIFTLLIIAATFILVFGMRFLASRQAAQARMSKEEAYRDLAAKAAQSQGEAVGQLAGCVPSFRGSLPVWRRLRSC